MRLGIFDHFGWAVAVTANAEYEVVDRRRMELVEPGVTPAPMHYDSARLDVDETAVLIETVRDSIRRAASTAFDELEVALPEPIRRISLRTWPADFPTDLAVLRRAPYESRADAVMYRQILAELARARGWDVHLYDAKHVIDRAVSVLGTHADAVLQEPRARLGPPWTKDHRFALAATVAAG